MNAETKEAPTIETAEEGLQIFLPRHLTENFQTALNQIQEQYGLSPDLPSLVRLWLACGTSSLIRGEFENAVWDIKRRMLNPSAEGVVDEDPS